MDRKIVVLVLGMLVGVSAFHGIASAAMVTGEVVDVTCYVAHSASGESHAGCGQKCISSGMPVAIKAQDGMYLAVGDEHGTANSQLAALAGKQVTVEGDIAERDGMKLITIKKVNSQK